MKHKIWDKVKVKSYEKLSEQYTNCNGDIEINENTLFVEEMKQYCGKCLTIAYIGNSYYKVKQDKHTFAWTDEMFED